METFDEKAHSTENKLPPSLLSSSSTLGSCKQKHPYNFPFQPYPIQLNFMNQMYTVMEEGKIGLFESPTGTGKTLSIICASLSWLLDNYNGVKVKKTQETCDHHKNLRKRSRNQGSESLNQQQDADEEDPEWLREQQLEMEREKQMDQQILEKKQQETRKKRVRKYSSNRRRFMENVIKDSLDKSSEAKDGGSVMNHNKKKVHENDGNEEDDEFMINDYDSDEECKPQSNQKERLKDKKLLNEIGLSANLLDELFSSDEEEEEKTEANLSNTNAMPRKHRISLLSEDDDPNTSDTYYTPKIIYCSRTHSQLSQFVDELKRTEFSSMVRVVSLASRQNMCIHPAVSKLKSLTRINEKCLEMKNNSGKSQKKKACSFYDVSSHQLFKDHVLVKVRDIEELVSLGKRIESCPYYGSRRAVPHSQVIVLPYASLIHAPTRESLGIASLQDCVVIIDEAHNLVDAVTNTHSVQISASQIYQAFGQLSRYFAKYQNRLKPKNQSRVKQVLSIMNHFLSYMKHSIKEGPPVTSINQTSKQENLDTKIFNLNDFVFATNVDNINLFKVVEFIQKSELTKKLNGFVEKAKEKLEQDKDFIHLNSNSSQKKNDLYDGNIESGIHAFVAFLLALTNIDSDGKIMVQINRQNSGKSFFKFVLLNPSIYFSEVVKGAKSVILAGGTMEPISTIIHQLFPQNQITNVESKCTTTSPLNDNKSIHLFQCDHIIPENHLLPICLSKGPSGITLDFTYTQRSSPHTKKELGNIILSLCRTVPDGIICFFPSYSYEDEVFAFWEKEGMMAQMENIKKIFREPKTSSLVEDILNDYKRTINSNFPVPPSKQSSQKQNQQHKVRYKGALLSCIVGGKMSEGINFSDGYCRCVLIVGLPYPNKNDPELKEKMDFLRERQSKAESEEYYTNLCMKAVNQSIGRSIRHAKDYSSILFVDKRYNDQISIRRKLPKWIQKRLQCHKGDYQQFEKTVKQFFDTKRNFQDHFYAERREKYTQEVQKFATSPNQL